jgi:hypothetical protein
LGDFFTDSSGHSGGTAHFESLQLGLNDFGGQWLFQVAKKQGDQIGRFFAYWAIVYFGRFIDTDRSGPSFCAFPHGSGHVLFLTKHGWATFWANSSQTHLVTLPTNGTLSA